MNFFRYNIVVAAYPVFVYVVSRAGRQVDLPPCTRNKTLSLLLYVSIEYRLSSSGSIYCSKLKSSVKNMNFFVIILLWQHICTLFLVQGGKWQVHLPPCTRNNVHKCRICCTTILIRKVHILTRDFS